MAVGQFGEKKLQTTRPKKFFWQFLRGNPVCVGLHDIDHEFIDWRHPLCEAKMTQDSEVIVSSLVFLKVLNKNFDLSAQTETFCFKNTLA